MERLKAKRGARRGQTTKIINEATESLAEAQATLPMFRSLLERLEASGRELHVLNEGIDALIDDEHIAQEYASVMEYEDNIVKTTALLKTRITALSRPVQDTLAPLTPSTEGTIGGRSSRVRLPKLQLQPFRGELSRWQPFWEQFRGAIHQNEELTGSEKFQYLRTLLSGPAAAAIAGLQATEACYQSAIDLLTQRFGDQKRIELEHLGKLRGLPAVSAANDTRGLRRLYDHLLVHIRGLRGIGVSPSTYGTLLKDILLRALPTEITVEYHRRAAHASTGPVLGGSQQTGDHGDQPQGGSGSPTAATVGSELDSIIEFLRIEVESREKAPPSNTSKTESISNSTKAKKARASSAVLHAGTNTTSTCAFCKAERHVTGDCDAPIDLLQKKRILAAEGRCFRCRCFP